MKTNWKLELPQILLVVAMLIWAAFAWSVTPERVPVHWNARGEVDGYGGRFIGVLLVPLISAFLYLLLRFIPLLDPGKANYKHFTTAYGIVRLTVLTMLAAVYTATQFVIHGVKVDMGRLMPLLMGAMFIVLGAVIGKVRPNWFVGVRTPWTLSSKLSWDRTHRLAGRLFVAAGALAVLAAFILPPQWGLGVLMIGAGGAAITSIVYSWVVWRSDPDKIPPAGTLPAE